MEILDLSKVLASKKSWNITSDKVINNHVLCTNNRGESKVFNGDWIVKLIESKEIVVNADKSFSFVNNRPTADQF